MNALSYLNAEALDRVPTPHIVGLVKCSAHGRSFVRLQYNYKQTAKSTACVNYDYAN